MNFTVRAMADADVDRVLDIENRTFANPWRRSFFVADLNRPGGLAIVADDQSRGVVGYLVAWGSDEVHVANVAVDAPWRGQGIGKRLMAEAERFAVAQNAASLYLEVRVSNEVARKFYAGLGFVPTYLRKGYYENGEDAVVMEKDAPAAGSS